MLERLGSVLDCVDVSQNELSDQGVKFLVDFLLARGVRTQRLKLFNNELREPTALCRFLEDPHCGVGGKDGLGELHLSHNGITSRTVYEVIDAVGRRLRNLGGRIRPPLWLRFERNGDHLQEVERHLQKETTVSGVQVCLQAGTSGSGCNLKQCKHGADVHVVFNVIKKRF